jgi:uncharacterized membrane protein
MNRNHGRTSLVVGYLAIGAAALLATGHGLHPLNPFWWVQAALWLPLLILGVASFVARLAALAAFVAVVAGAIYLFRRPPTRPGVPEGGF